MLIITMPDGSTKKFNNAITVKEIAKNIDSCLAKIAIAGKVNGKIVDTSFLIKNNAKVNIITTQDSEGLDVIRHSCAHLMAQAVKRLFSTVKLTIGPVIEDGFYYDFDFERPFTIKDLEKIEEKMWDIVKENYTISRIMMKHHDAIDFFKIQNEKYKVEIIKDIPTEEILYFYKQGEFIDLCLGPHVPNTGMLSAFKLTKVAGAYWKGNPNNPMLQRIYGTAWPNKKTLDNYLYKIDKAKNRDYRKLGKKFDLFHFQPEAPGMVFWHKKGWAIYLQIKDYIRKKLHILGYEEVQTPQIVSKNLWEKSGHWEIFRENMFTLGNEDDDFAIKPMSCPCHVQIFNNKIRSYRDLPIRISEFGSCHRYEPSGTLHGLMRLRHFVQDDAHIFCTEEQIQEEISHVISLVYDIYADFGFKDIIVRLSTRPEKRVGTNIMWNKAEYSLKQALKNAQLNYEICSGDGAFYGPKIEFSMRDNLNRIWQCGTIQVDFSMPERLNAYFINKTGNKQVPIMLHRAILGSLERFIGILIEYFDGSFPTWIAPIQVVVMSITDEHRETCNNVTNLLITQGFRVTKDLRNEKIGFKIREHAIQRIPYLLVIGDREVVNKTVSVGTRDSKKLGSMNITDFISIINKDIDSKGNKPLA